MKFERFAFKQPCGSCHVSWSFTCFFMYEIDVGGPKILYKHIQVGNIRENIPKDHSRVLEEGPLI